MDTCLQRLQYTLQVRGAKQRGAAGPRQRWQAQPGHSLLAGQRLLLRWRAVARQWRGAGLLRSHQRPQAYGQIQSLLHRGGGGDSVMAVCGCGREGEVKVLSLG